MKVFCVFESWVDYVPERRVPRGRRWGLYGLQRDQTTERGERGGGFDLCDSLLLFGVSMVWCRSFRGPPRWTAALDGGGCMVSARPSEILAAGRSRAVSSLAPPRNSGGPLRAVRSQVVDSTRMGAAPEAACIIVIPIKN